MMTRMKITRRIILKQCFLLPVIFVAIIMFSNNSVAQEVKKALANEEKVVMQKQTNSEEELQSAFDNILNSYIKEKNSRRIYYGNFSEEDMNQLLSLFQKMSKSQQSRQIVQIRPPLKKRMPTKEEFEKWKDPKIYGVWLDGKRISNDLLINYKNTDISHFSASGLTKTAKNYGKHVYQLDARTNADFEAYNMRLKTDPYLTFMPVRKK